jgi:hydroxymethylbilane synthase
VSPEYLPQGPDSHGLPAAPGQARKRPSVRKGLIVGTRGSRLALRQTEIALAALTAAVPETTFEVQTIRTAGDQSAASLSEIGGRGVFVVEIERALLERQIDIAVHSLKDLPAEETPGLAIAAVLAREDPRDALVTRSGALLADLPEGSVIGTGSPRRAAQLLALRRDIRIADIRGNVDTRIRKAESGEYDAVVLAAAGLARLGWIKRAAELFDYEQMLPAPGQGALALQVRTDDAAAFAAVLTVDHAYTRAAITAERAFERRLGGGCHAAIAALATVLDEERIRLAGLVGDPEGGLMFRREIDGTIDDPASTGLLLAEELLERGAAALLEAAS